MAPGTQGEVQFVSPSPNPLVLSLGDPLSNLLSGPPVQRHARVFSIENKPPNSHHGGVRALPALGQTPVHLPSGATGCHHFLKSAGESGLGSGLWMVKLSALSHMAGRQNPCLCDFKACLQLTCSAYHLIAWGLSEGPWALIPLTLEGPTTHLWCGLGAGRWGWSWKGL